MANELKNGIESMINDVNKVEGVETPKPQPQPKADPQQDPLRKNLHSQIEKYEGENYDPMEADTRVGDAMMEMEQPQEKDLSDTYRGIEGTRYAQINGNMASPVIEYKDKTFYYDDIEDALWDYYKEDMASKGLKADANKFDEWIANNKQLVKDEIDNIYNAQVEQVQPIKENDAVDVNNLLTNYQKQAYIKGEDGNLVRLSDYLYGIEPDDNVNYKVSKVNPDGTFIVEDLAQQERDFNEPIADTRQEKDYTPKQYVLDEDIVDEINDYIESNYEGEIDLENGLTISVENAPKIYGDDRDYNKIISVSTDDKAVDEIGIYGTEFDEEYQKEIESIISSYFAYENAKNQQQPQEKAKIGDFVHSDIQNKRYQQLKTDNLIKDAVKEFGITNRFNSAMYMLPNGSMLDGSHGTGYQRGEDHRSIATIYPHLDYEYQSDYMNDFMKRGAIRLMPENNSIELLSKPTSNQINAILNLYARGYIQNAEYNGEYLEDISSERQLLNFLKSIK